MGVPVDGGRAAVSLGAGLLGDRLGLLVAGAEHGHGLVALRAQRDDLFQPLTHRGGALQLVLLVGLLPPRLAQLGEHLVQGAGRGVAGGLPARPGRRHARGRGQPGPG